MQFLFGSKLNSCLPHVYFTVIRLKPESYDLNRIKKTAQARIFHLFLYFGVIVRSLLKEKQLAGLLSSNLVIFSRNATIIMTYYCIINRGQTPG